MPKKDPFNEDETELEVLTRKPVCFIVTGKPGTGKTTLAKRLAAVWKCQLIDGASTIKQAIRDKTPMGIAAKERLLNGEELGEAFMIQVILEKLDSLEIEHYDVSLVPRLPEFLQLRSKKLGNLGYVLDCLPSLSGDWQPVEQQIEFIRELKMGPDVIINLKVPDQDLQKRRIGQKVDPLSNEVFIKSVYDPQSRSGRKSEGEEEGEEEEEEDREDEEEGEEEGEKESAEDEFEDDLGEMESLDHLAADIADRLVRRPLDLPTAVEGQIKHFKDNILRPLEDYIVQHNRQYVIELDANLPPLELFKSLLLRLTSLGLPRSPAPKRLLTPEEDEEEPVGIDTDQFMQQITETGILYPKFRWRRSRWGRYCPVQLACGNMVQGRMEFSVGFLDKVYCLSSADALFDFTRNPRGYLLPPNPRIPCKVCIVGPPTSGKSTLARAVAEKYNATVIDVSQFLEPVVARAHEAAVEEARQEAIDRAISTVTLQLKTQKEEEGQGGNIDEVTSEHPEVQRLVAAAVAKARHSKPTLTQDMYAEALKMGIEKAEEKRREDDPLGQRFGGWVVDNFPLTREHWAVMIEHNLLPDFVLSLEDEGVPRDYLLARFTTLRKLPDPAAMKAAGEAREKAMETLEEGAEKPPPAVPIEVEEWQKQRAEYDRQWGQLSAAIKGSAIDPIPIEYSLSLKEMLDSAVKQMEGVFDLKVAEFSALEEDADVDDDPILDQDEEEGEGEGEENEELQRKRKPWGDSSHFCPVALKEQGVLWPGNQDIAVRYRERLYFFCSDEAKTKFTANPRNYTAGDSPLQPPPLRLFLLGPRGSGKTVVGRRLAKKLEVFHVAFRDYMQETVLPKMKRPPLVNEDEWEGGEEGEGGEGGAKEEDEDLEPDVRVKLSGEEGEIRSYLLYGDPLSEETIEKYSTQFWNTEPYKSMGFIMEGFPSSGDELRFLASKGMFPNGAVILQVEEGDVVRRLLPGRVAAWKRKRDKRLEMRAKTKEKKVKEWEEDKVRRKTDLTEQYEAKMAAKKAEKERQEEEEEEGGEEEDDPDTEEYREQLTELEEEQFPEDEEEGEGEEEEGDARERMRATIVEKFEEQTEALSTLQDILAELQIPYHTVSGSRKVPVVQYSIEKATNCYTTNSQGLLAKCTAINGDMAKKLLYHGYKQLSKFKRWCPVKLLSDPTAVLPPAQQPKSQMFPVIHHQRVYFTSSSEAREQFVANPHRFMEHPPPGPAVPIRMAIVGPPKSGKSSIAQRFVQEYGCVRLSIGEAMRRVMTQFPDSELTRLMKTYLLVGETVPDNLCVLALERSLLDVQCNTRGYVLDGWPQTKAHVDLLVKYHVIPVCIVEVKVSDQEMLRRGEVERNSPERTQPLHDSGSILLVRSNHYHRHIGEVRDWYHTQHDNWHTFDGERSQWWVWNEVRKRTLLSAQRIQQFVASVTSGRAASIADLCISPKDFQEQLGEFSHYCPVSLATKGELVDCSGQTSLQLAAGYRGKYYRMASSRELEAFLATPQEFTPPKAPRNLPPPERLPRRRSRADVKAMFPKQFEIQGFCPVSYVDGNKRYESLQPGNPELAVECMEKLYCCSTEERLEKFMRKPCHYAVTTLPAKLPPLRKPVPVTSLPMLGYLEQSVATAVINSLSAVGGFKPKYPFLNSTKSALMYVALYLKAYNPKSSGYIRNKYKKELAKFEEQCHLICYLSTSMRHGYQEPKERPIDFRHKMSSFLKLRTVTS